MAYAEVTNDNFKGTSSLHNQIKEYQGYSTDTKPDFLTSNNTGSSLLEIDTLNCFVWHIDQWVPLQ